MTSFNQLQELQKYEHVTMCEKCRRRHFQSEGGSKNFEDWGKKGVKRFWDLGGLFQISHNCVTECTLQARFFLTLKSN